MTGPRYDGKCPAKAGGDQHQPVNRANVAHYWHCISTAMLYADSLAQWKRCDHALTCCFLPTTFSSIFLYWGLVLNLNALDLSKSLRQFPFKLVEASWCISGCPNRAVPSGGRIAFDGGSSPPVAFGHAVEQGTTNKMCKFCSLASARQADIAAGKLLAIPLVPICFHWFGIPGYVYISTCFWPKQSYFKR